MKKNLLLTSLFAMMLFVSPSCSLLGESEESEDVVDESVVSESGSTNITIGDSSPLLTLQVNEGNNVECSINSSWLCQNLVSIEANVLIDGVDNAQDYYTRSTDASATQWGVSISSVNTATGIFYIYLEAPTDLTYREMPAILKVTIYDADGGESVSMRSIKYDSYNMSSSVMVDGIPEDDSAGETPEVEENSVTLPDFSGAKERDPYSGFYYIYITITGIADGLGDYLDLKGTNDPDQNIWLEFDNIPKSIIVEKVTSTTRVMNDIVFLVDNSGSMSDEANAVATSIQAWANELYEAGIDAMFGCVGYNDSGTISGAIDLTDVTSISTYLDRTTGTSRTKGFDTTELSAMATESTYATATGECGVVALRFADDLFSFREGSNRIYVNFTDEPNQTNGYTNNSVEYVNDSSWSGRGTIHTVYSSTSCSTSGYNEDPRLMSDYTGGTTMTVSSSFTGVTLSDIPVSDAILNSYIVRFTNIEKYIGTFANYDVKIVVKDAAVQSTKTSIIGL